MDAFVEWFQSNGGFVDLQAMGITEFPGSGRGAIALRDIPEGHTLFTLPRALTLSTRTSPLPALFGADAWHAHGLHRGWVGLLLCMMWEDAWAHEENARTTTWGPYLRALPTTFDTPMFWSAAELEELRGTAVIDKLGREDAERAYAAQLVPAINTSPTLFPPSHHETWYTLDAYHRAGSRVLSRSFMVSPWTGDEENDIRHGEEAVEAGSDAEEAENPELDTDERLDLISEDDEDDPSDVAMVPMADLLNARWGSENAKLFYEPTILRMVATKEIKQGEQIFNTYGDPPNSELLRRYGHVDLVPLRPLWPAPTLDIHGDIEMRDGDVDVETIKHLGNPSDVVEIRADLVVDVARTTGFGSEAEDAHARIEWWLDEGEDDTFVFGVPEPSSHLSAVLPPAVVSLIRLLTLSEPGFQSARLKGKLPKGKLNKADVADNERVLRTLGEVIKQRERMYIGGSIEDECLLLADKTLTERKRHAVIVRLGEKRILRNVGQRIRTMLAELGSTSGGAVREHKTKNGGEGEKGGKETGCVRKRVVGETEGDHVRKKARQ